MQSSAADSKVYTSNSNFQASKCPGATHNSKPSNLDYANQHWSLFPNVASRQETVSEKHDR